MYTLPSHMNNRSHHDLISEIHHLCEKKKYTFMIFQKYTIIFLIFIGNEVYYLFGWRWEGGRVKESGIESAKNKLILY